MKVTQYAVLDLRTREQLTEWLYERKAAISILLATEKRERRGCMLTVREVEIGEDEQ